MAYLQLFMLDSLTNKKQMYRLKLLSFFFALVVMASCTRTPEKVVSISPDSFSVEDQIKIGTTFKTAISTAPNLFNILPEDEYPEAYEYVSAVYQSLLFTSQVTRRNAFDWTLTILHDDEKQTAFFLPGGHLHITTGVLKYIETESQLFSIIVHELYYVETDEMITVMKKEFGSTTLGDILLDNPLEDMDEMAAQMPHLTLKSYQVLDADKYIIDLICPFRYDAYSLNSFIGKVLETPAAERPLWLMTRAGDEQLRLQKMEEYANGCGEEGTTNEQEYNAFKEMHLP
jgi:predicted Zn-dependent protease